MNTNDPHVEAVEALTHQLIHRKIDRRTFIARAILMGLTSASIANIIAACEAASQQSSTPPAPQSSPTPSIPTIPEVSVKFASLFGLDHSYIVIPLKRGWNKDVGITILPEPFGSLAPGGQEIAILVSGSVDIAAGSVTNALGAYETSSQYVDFGHGDLFLGFGFMVDPERYMTVNDFVKQGLSEEDAYRRTVEQFRGKTVASFLGSIQAIVAAMLEKGGLQYDDITFNGFDSDSKIIAELVAGRADIGLGSAPGRVAMQNLGFVPAVTTQQIIKDVAPSPESEALLAIFHDGWVTTRTYWEENHDTVFRFASMMYRTLRVMHDTPEEVVGDHVNYFNSLSGLSLTPEDGLVVYKELDPFVPYEDQGPWYDDEFRASSVSHYYNVTGRHIKYYEEQGLLPPGKWTPETVTVAFELRREFKEREENARNLIAEAGQLVKDTTPQAKELLDRATFYLEIYDFLDAERFAQGAIDWVKVGS